MKTANHTIWILSFVILTAANTTFAQSEPNRASQTFTINGNVEIGGVRMQGLPGDIFSDASGFYSATVSAGFRGEVQPVKEGYEFNPTSREYRDVRSNHTEQDYAPMSKTFTISGNVRGIAGVQMVGFPGDVITDSRGNFSVEVPYGWSGTVTPTKPGYQFSPARRVYNNLTEDITSSGYNNYSTSISATAAQVEVAAEKAIVIPDSESQAGDFDEVIEDMQVMLHILDDKLDAPIINIQNENVNPMILDRLLNDLFDNEQNKSEAIYLQGYGILFLIEANFPIISSQMLRTTQEEVVNEEDDSVWRQAQRQVLGENTPSNNISNELSEALNLRVSTLQAGLIDAMKQASNIRQVNPNEWVIINVTGLNQSSGTYLSADPFTGTVVYGSGYGAGFHTTSSNRNVTSNISAPSVVMTIRAKKDDIDKLAREEITSEEFEQLVTVYSY